MVEKIINVTHCDSGVEHSGFVSSLKDVPRLIRTSITSPRFRFDHEISLVFSRTLFFYLTYISSDFNCYGV